MDTQPEQPAREGSLPVLPTATQDACACGPATGSSPETGPVVALSTLNPGQVGRIVEKRLDEADREVLRAMGLATACMVRLCRAGEPCIVAILSGGRGADGAPAARLGATCCRIGLAKPLAERIFVRVSVPTGTGRP
jgi:Fe2+ transport system protein FeoA